MTSWVTFETIDESQNWDQFYIDRLGMHSYVQDLERSRFEVKRVGTEWIVEDMEASGDEYYKFQGPMRDVIHWVAGRILYGA